jgi:hypothetical protein
MEHLARRFSAGLPSVGPAEKGAVWFLIFSTRQVHKKNHLVRHQRHCPAINSEATDCLGYGIVEPAKTR